MRIILVLLSLMKIVIGTSTVSVQLPYANPAGVTYVNGKASADLIAGPASIRNTHIVSSTEIPRLSSEHRTYERYIASHDVTPAHGVVLHSQPIQYSTPIAVTTHAPAAKSYAVVATPSPIGRKAAFIPQPVTTYYQSRYLERPTSLPISVHESTAIPVVGKAPGIQQPISNYNQDGAYLTRSTAVPVTIQHATPVHVYQKATVVQPQIATFHQPAFIPRATTIPVIAHQPAPLVPVVPAPVVHHVVRPSIQHVPAVADVPVTQIHEHHGVIQKTINVAQPAIKTRKFEVRRPAIQKQFYDIEERIIVRPAGSVVLELDQPISKTQKSESVSAVQGHYGAHVISETHSHQQLAPANTPGYLPQLINQPPGVIYAEEKNHQQQQHQDQPDHSGHQQQQEHQMQHQEQHIHEQEQHIHEQELHQQTQPPALITTTFAPPTGDEDSVIVEARSNQDIHHHVEQHQSGGDHVNANLTNLFVPAPTQPTVNHDLSSGNYQEESARLIQGQQEYERQQIHQGQHENQGHQEQITQHHQEIARTSFQPQPQQHEQNLQYNQQSARTAFPPQPQQNEQNSQYNQQSARPEIPIQEQHHEQNAQYNQQSARTSLPPQERDLEQLSPNYQYSSRQSNPSPMPYMITIGEPNFKYPPYVETHSNGAPPKFQTEENTQHSAYTSDTGPARGDVPIEHSGSHSARIAESSHAANSHFTEQQSDTNQKQYLDFLLSRGSVSEIGFNPNSPPSHANYAASESGHEGPVRTRVIAATPAPRDAEPAGERVHTRRIVVSHPIETVQEIEEQEHFTNVHQVTVKQPTVYKTSSVGLKRVQTSVPVYVNHVTPAIAHVPVPSHHFNTAHPIAVSYQNYQNVH